jgi:hypothetical protein
LGALLEKLMAWFIANPDVSFEMASTSSDNDTGGKIDLKKVKHAA